MTSKLNHIVFGSSDTQNPGHDDRRPPKDDTDDSSGNMTYDGLNTLVYDAENHTVSATNSSSSGTYVYDGNGLRVQKCVPNCTSPTTNVVFVYSGSLELAEYYNGVAPANPTNEYIYAGGQKVAADAGVHVLLVADELDAERPKFLHRQEAVLGGTSEPIKAPYHDCVELPLAGIVHQFIKLGA